MLANRSLVALCLMGLVLVTACGKKKEKGSGVTASLELGNSTGTTLKVADDHICPVASGFNSNFDCYTPTKYAIKILNAIVSPDAEGAKTAAAGLIWVNPACSTSTQTSDVDGKETSYDYMDQNCSDADVSTYFDFARTTDAVNADLNSQKHAILPGTYNYVQIAFCNGSAQSKNFEFLAEGMTEAFQAKQDSCGVTSAKANPAIVVGEGDNVTIHVDYDLTNVIVDIASGGGTIDPDTCYSAAGVTRCLGGNFNLTASVSKN